MAKKTYVGWQELGYKRNQVEYKEPTKLLADDGTLLVQGGWARHNVFEYDRTKAQPQKRGKEWDFYQLSDGKYMLQISVANISIGGYASAVLLELDKAHNRKGKIITSMSLFLGGKNKYVLPENGDKPNYFEYNNGKFKCIFDTKATSRKIYFEGPVKGKKFVCDIDMDLFEDHESITIVTPFKKRGKFLPTRFFMTMKQNCMPAYGTVKLGDETLYTFKKEDTMCVLDWGRGVWPYRNVWYWGNGAKMVKGADGKEHMFGFEITWGIGCEDNATETCLFWDGKAQKIGSVDVETFPKGKYMEPWKFVSEDGRFNLTMTPYYDHHSDMNVLKIVRLHSHQVHGLWNGTVTLDSGEVVEIKDMYAFCEYVENKW